jgi:hypothetical protein
MRGNLDKPDSHSLGTNGFWRGVLCLSETNCVNSDMCHVQKVTHDFRIPLDK